MLDVKENPEQVERAFLVGVYYPNESEEQTHLLLEELKELLANLGIETIAMEAVRIQQPKPKYLIGSGRMADIIAAAKAEECDCIIFDNELSPAQQRNWEHDSQLCVVDRQEIILDIFRDRAQTKEASLQVELARLEYQLPRLKRAWTHLSRQRGGSSTQRGEGEAQIELDARMVRDRIARVKRELKAVVKHRSTQRKQRLKVPLPTTALVGYTNAGKSSLLNALTQAEVFAADQLFATLDPTTRQLRLPKGQKLLVTDTVGFVRRLPHRLIEAFKATLEEARLANFLIHLLDASSPEVKEHQQTTLDVLKELEADQKPIITVYNKIDLLTTQERTHLPKGEHICHLSTHTGEGLKALLEEMETVLGAKRIGMELLIPHNRYDLIAKLHQHGQVEHEEALDEGVAIDASVEKRFSSLFEDFKR